MRAALLVTVLSLACPAAAQTRIGKAELAHARELLDRSRKELSPEQWALLSGKLAEAEVALAGLTAAAEAGGETAVVVAQSPAAAALATVADVLPLLVFFWPATAHAPGVKESAATRTARVKVENSLRDLAQAAHQVEAQRAAAMEAKLPLDDDEGCQQFAEGGTGGPERFCYYACGSQNICVRVDGRQQCPSGPRGPTSPIKFRALARLPKCPPRKQPN